MRHNQSDPPPGGQRTGAARDARQITALAEDWWNPQGAYKSLHSFNSLRVRFLRDRIARHFGREPDRRLPLNGVRVLDIACGGGLLTENVAFMGADVVGIDTSADLVNAARVHAEINFVPVDYRFADAPGLAAQGERFDAVIDTLTFGHGSDLDAAVQAICRLVKPGGIIVVAARNRTWTSRLLAKVGATHVSAVVPGGPRLSVPFITPDELAHAFARYGVTVQEIAGVACSRFLGTFRLIGDPSSAFLAVAVRPHRPTLTVVS